MTREPKAAATPTIPAAAVDGVKYGAGVTSTDAVAIDTLLADPKAYAGKTVRVEGMITDVCPKRGCWMQLAGDKPGQSLKFKVDDGEMTFPVDAKGKWAVAQGVVAVRDLTLEETKQKAEYEAKEYGRPYEHHEGIHVGAPRRQARRSSRPRRRAGRRACGASLASWARCDGASGSARCIATSVTPRSR